MKEVLFQRGKVKTEKLFAFAIGHLNPALMDGIEVFAATGLTELDVINNEIPDSATTKRKYTYGITFFFDGSG
jgi:hypothetical protein